MLGLEAVQPPHTKGMLEDPTEMAEDWLRAMWMWHEMELERKNSPRVADGSKKKMDESQEAQEGSHISQKKRRDGLQVVQGTSDGAHVVQHELELRSEMVKKGAEAIRAHPLESLRQSRDVMQPDHPNYRGGQWQNLWSAG